MADPITIAKQVSAIKARQQQAAQSICAALGIEAPDAVRSHDKWVMERNREEALATLLERIAAALPQAAVESQPPAPASPEASVELETLRDILLDLNEALQEKNYVSVAMRERITAALGEDPE
jgi:hypothetical protein